MEVHLSSSSLAFVTWSSSSTSRRRVRQDACNVSRRRILGCVLSAGLGLRIDTVKNRPLLAAEYDRYAAEYDALEESVFADGFGLKDLREFVTKRADGEVLELAVGTGLNIGYYDASRVESFMGVDISEEMLKIASARGSSLGTKASFQIEDASRLSFKSSSFDTIVDTYSFCTFYDPQAVITELRRVCKPTGKLVLVEHVRSDNRILGVYQNVTNAAVKTMSKGCAWNQNIPQLLENEGFQISFQKRFLAGTVIAVVARPRLDTQST
ncbi:hypothetical protein NDN08_000266 [Rhodosorus marinus]|uniref:Methyltransferase type 11 domain-containing protein n=1 Tax=Rhodosorus marinus TaxID=101924 RepID=A0AAV8UG64_9RHOD|nr:hypothetical protein NDN08_000266 [Rhodosorus marinus]